MVVKIMCYTDKNGVYYDEYLADLQELLPNEQEQEQTCENCNFFEEEEREL